MLSDDKRSRGSRPGARLLAVPVTATMLSAAAVQPVLGHENQVIQYGSFLTGLTHPVLGLDHFLAMVSVGIVSALIGGRAIITVERGQGAGSGAPQQSAGLVS